MTHDDPPNPTPDPTLPRHVAVIMDGNGRWATSRGLTRSEGHSAGTEAVRPIVTRAAGIGLEALTLYSFSTENWTRSRDEVDHLMQLCVHYLAGERRLFMQNNIRFRAIGRRDGLPENVLRELDETTRMTADNTGMTLCIALNYGSRSEIVDAVRAIVGKARAGRLEPDAVDEHVIEEHLYTAGLPNPDLLIRTAGEMRLSNYLLWQLSYAEIYVTDLCWPDFDVDQFHLALEAYRGRTRKFGGVV